MSGQPDAVDKACALASAVGKEEFSLAISNTADLLRRFSVLALAMHQADKDQNRPPRISDNIISQLPHHNQVMSELRVSAVAKVDELDVGTVVEVSTHGGVNEAFIRYFIAAYGDRLRESVKELKVLVDLVVEEMTSAEEKSVVAKAAQ